MVEYYVGTLCVGPRDACAGPWPPQRCEGLAFWACLCALLAIRPRSSLSALRMKHPHVPCDVPSVRECSFSVGAAFCGDFLDVEVVHNLALCPYLSNTL